MKIDSFTEFFTSEFLMGPNSMRLMGELAEKSGVDFRGKRALDLGCGQGLTSLYITKALGAGQLFSADLWIDATAMEKNFVKWGIDDRAFPMHSDANDMPFADNFFDVIASVDSYHYFGARPGFFAEKIWPLLKKGGYMPIGDEFWEVYSYVHARLNLYDVYQLVQEWREEAIANEY